MENCLVTKLREVVNNNKLQVFGCVTIRDITPGDNAQNRALFRMCMKEDESAILKVINGVFLDISTHEPVGDTFTVRGGNIDNMSYVSILPSDGCKVFINNKYNIKGLNFNASSISMNNMKVNGEDLSFLPELKVLNFGDDANTVCSVLEGTLSSAEDTELKKFMLSKNNTAGNLAEIIPVKDSIEYILCNNCPNIKVSLNYFADAPKLNYIRIYGSMENNTWASSTLRTTGPILCGSFSFNDSTSVDNFLINMAALDFIYPGNVYLKNITIYGAGRTSASDTAVATIKAKTDINNVQFGKIYINGVEQ